MGTEITLDWQSFPQAWIAYDANTSDGAEDSGRQMLGRGKTQEAALADFHEQMDAVARGD